VASILSPAGRSRKSRIFQPGFAFEASFESLALHSAATLL
jgi:hypothetical protein